MAGRRKLTNRVREYRDRLDWSQEELARRAGLSRAGVGAIETGRLVPSAVAALSLSSAFGCRVEDLFRLSGIDPGEPVWAWPPGREPCRFWHAEVNGRVRLYPAEPTPLGMIEHDGVSHEGTLRVRDGVRPSDTLVVASCDPAAGLLATELARAGVRLIVLPRSSRAALALLGKGLVHAAGVHLVRAGEQVGNVAAVKGQLGPGYDLLRLARWEEGIVFRPGLGLSSVQSAMRADLRWVGREEGSGARQCLDELLGSRRPPRRMAHDHRGVAEAIRCGWAEAGVCLRLAGEEAGLDFLGVRQEAYDLCVSASLRDDPRMRALVAAVRSANYRRALGELPGYDSVEAGEIQSVS